MSREQAAKPFLKIPEGAPFWKYNVKDEVISAPVKTHKISENPAEGHSQTLKYPKEPETIEDFKCGRISKRLETLKNRYDDLQGWADRDR